MENKMSSNLLKYCTEVQYSTILWGTFTLVEYLNFPLYFYSATIQKELYLLLHYIYPTAIKISIYIEHIKYNTFYCIKLKQPKAATSNYLHVKVLVLIIE